MRIKNGFRSGIHVVCIAALGLSMGISVAQAQVPPVPPVPPVAPPAVDAGSLL